MRHDRSTTCLMPARWNAWALLAVILASGLGGRAVVAQDAEVRQVSAPVDVPLRVGNLKVAKILFLGNSITHHGPAPGIGWEGDWGMAASSRDRDYVHLLIAAIEKVTGAKPAFKVKNIADFERGLGDYDVATRLKDELAFQADVVIVALGENAAPPATDAEKTQFRHAFDGLFAELKKHGAPTIFVRSQFWADAEKDGLMKLACQRAEGVFVDISTLGKDEANFARSERKIEHAGVAGHPGDRGMKALADALWSAIQKQGKASP